MPLLATKILSDYISQMRNLHSEVISTWQEIKDRCNIHGSLLKKVQSFDVLLNLINIQHGLLSDEVPNVKREFKRQLSVRDTKIKELVAKLDHLPPSVLHSHAGGRPPYVESRRYPKSTTPNHRRSNKRNSNRAPVPRIVSADNIRGGPISDSPFYSSRTPYISASPSVASKAPSISVPPISPRKQWSSMDQMDPLEDQFIDEIAARISVNKMEVSPRTRKKNATDLRSDLKRSQRSLTKSNSRTVERERMDLQETSLTPRSPPHLAARRNRMRRRHSPQHYNSRSPRKPNSRIVPNIDPVMESEHQPRLIRPNKAASPRVKPRAQSSPPQVSPRQIPPPEAPPRHIPPTSPSRAKKDPTTDPQIAQDEMIRKEFELLGIEYTPENVQIPASNTNVSPLEDDAVNFDAMQSIVIPNENDSNIETSPGRRRSRRPSLCRPDNVGDWADTEEGREHAKQLEQEMIRELARLNCQALKLSPAEMKKQEELLIQGLTENDENESFTTCTEDAYGIESDSESEISDLNSESDISYSTIGSPRASSGPAMSAMASPRSAVQGSPPIANLALS